MTFVKMIAQDAATGGTALLYEKALSENGRLSNIDRAFSHRPEYMEPWNNLLGAIKARMEPRRYELVTLAAALALKSSYCALAPTVRF